MLNLLRSRYMLSKGQQCWACHDLYLLGNEANHMRNSSVKYDCMCVHECVRECVCESVNDWRRANVSDQCGSVFFMKTEINTTFLLFLYHNSLTCILYLKRNCLYICSVYKINEKKEYDLLFLINNLELWLLGKNDGLEKLTNMDKHINIHCTKGCDSFIECIKTNVDMKMSSVFSERMD